MELSLAIGFLLMQLVLPPVTGENRHKNLWIWAAAWLSCAGIAIIVRGFDRVWNLQLPNLEVPPWLYGLALVLMGLPALGALAFTFLIPECGPSGCTISKAPSVSPSILGFLLGLVGSQIALIGFSFQVLCESFGTQVGLLLVLCGAVGVYAVEFRRKQISHSEPARSARIHVARVLMQFSRFALPAILFVDSGSLSHPASFTSIIGLIVFPFTEHFTELGEKLRASSTSRPVPKPHQVRPPRR